MLKLNFSQQLGSYSLRIDAQIPARGITAILGVSGAGKTSLINAISGLTKPQQGSISLNDQIFSDTDNDFFLPPEARHIGYIFQDARLFPHYRVRGNLCYGMAKSMSAQFDHLVKLLGIEPLLNRFPVSLSGGEKQRVAIGRALLTAPTILLMDEPLASLDLPRKRELMPYLVRLARQIDVPILYVTHSLDEIFHLADHLLVLDKGQVKNVGPLEQVWNSPDMHRWLPSSELSSVLQVRVLEHHPDYPMSALKLGDHLIWVNQVSAAPATSLRIRIYASDVSLVLQPSPHSSIRNVLPAQVCELLTINNQIEVKLRIGVSELWAGITLWACDEMSIKPGMWLYAQIKSVAITA